MARSWGDFKAQRRKYEGLHHSADFRPKKGLLEKLGAFINNLFGR